MCTSPNGDMPPSIVSVVSGMQHVSDERVNLYSACLDVEPTIESLWRFLPNPFGVCVSSFPIPLVSNTFGVRRYDDFSNPFGWTTHGIRITWHMHHMAHGICDAIILCITWHMHHVAYTSHGTWYMHRMAYAAHGVCITWHMHHMAYASHGICITCMTWHMHDMAYV